MDKQNERLIGNYRITENIGQGTFSEVYLAQHAVLTNRIVAIKLLVPVFGKIQQEEFIREAHVLERLQHPHILPIYDVGFHDNRAYLVMEYASGGSLYNYIERYGRKRIPVEHTVKILLQISQALEYAHQQHIIHRDVKPGNILFNSSGEVLLADFGTAIWLDPERSETKLNTGGTPLYMAPERFAGTVSAASDQYALGCIAYELLTGQRPFIADNVFKVMIKHKQEMPIPLRQLVPDLPPTIEEVVLKALAKDREERFASIRDFAVALEKAVKDTHTNPSVSPSRGATPKLITTLSTSTFLFEHSIPNDEERRDFFVTYHSVDRFWAEWIAWHLEDAGYATVLPAWDFHPGTDLSVEIPKASVKAKHIIAILSPDYFTIRKNLKEWDTTFGRDKLIPVLVRKCEQKHMKFLQSIVYIDLTDCDERVAHQLLLAGVRHERVKPVIPPPFPGQQHKPAIEDDSSFPAFPSISDDVQFAQQIMPLIQAAFDRKDWSDVLQKTTPLLNPEAAHTLTPELYHLHGLALFKVGEVEKARDALEIALASESNQEKRLVIQQDYTNILITLGQWTKVLSHANAVLQQVPDDSHWIAIQEQAQSQIKLKSQSLISVPQGIEVFFSYSHQDKVLRTKLEKYLSNLKRQHVIVGWHDDEIGAGGERDNEIKEHIDHAHIILLLVSQDFLASDHCYEKEMKRALERHEAGEARVIPIILRPTHWEITPFGKLQALPTGAKPVTLWPNRDEAFLDVVRGIQKVVDKLTRPMI